MGIVDVSEHMELAHQRYESGTARRENRKDLISRMRNGERGLNLSEIDAPERMLQRLLKMDEHGAADRFVKGLLAGDRGADELESPEDIFRERIIKKSDLKQVSFLEKALKASQSVGRILTRKGNHTEFGTGFTVSPRLVMTNWHVLPNKNVARKSEIQFNYREISPGNNTRPVVFKLDPETFFISNKRLDYCLVAVEAVNADNNQLEDRGWIPLIEESGKAIVGERVNVIQHPGGEPLQLAIQDNFIVDQDGDFLIYEADTMRGSSGSPVFNDQWQLAALHHTGVPVKDENGNILMITGEPWDGERRTAEMIQWKANEGARISKIISSLRRKSENFDENQQTLFQGLFQQPPEPVTRESTTSLPPSGTYGTNADADGFVTLTVPVTIKVGLNQKKPTS